MLVCDAAAAYCENNLALTTVQLTSPTATAVMKIGSGPLACTQLQGRVPRKQPGVADITLVHANNVNNTGQNITILNYLFGPRYTRRTYSRYVPYGQILVGGAKEDVNFQFTINRSLYWPEAM